MVALEVRARVADGGLWAVALCGLGTSLHRFDLPATPGLKILKIIPKNKDQDQTPERAQAAVANGRIFPSKRRPAGGGLWRFVRVGPVVDFGRLRFAGWERLYVDPPGRAVGCKKTKAPVLWTGAFHKNTSRRRPTLPHTCACSTIGAEGLNCRVRNGNGCFPLARVTGKFKLKRTKSLPT